MTAGADAAAWLRALARSWRDGAFRCFYTGACLTEDHTPAQPAGNPPAEFREDLV